MLQAPTGFGKTLTAAHIIAGAIQHGKRVAFLVPTLSLIDQTVAAFEAEGLTRIGVMQGNHPRRDAEAPIQVCSVQTLARRDRPDVDIVLVDEAHLAFENVFQWMAKASGVIFIGLSATPWKVGLGRHYDDLLSASTTAELIEAGFLSKFRVFAPSEPDLAAVRTVAGDYHEGELANLMNTPRLVGDVVDTWLMRAKDRPTFVFAVDRAHALHLAQRFCEAGVVAAYIDCNTERADREAIFACFRAGDVRVICNVNTLTAGIDLDVRCIVDARPTKSEMRYVQTIGRGLRTAPGKDHLVVLDHAGNVQRLGLVTDIHHDRLDDGSAHGAATKKKPERRAEIRLCPECKAVMPRGRFICDACGHEVLAKTEVLHTDGELVELGERRAARKGPSRMEQAEFLAELKGYAATKGYASGWALHKFKERFGHWPDDRLARLAEPRAAGVKTLNWIRSRQIAFARSRKHG